MVAPPPSPAVAAAEKAMQESFAYPPGSRERREMQDRAKATYAQAVAMQEMAAAMAPVAPAPQPAAQPKSITAQFAGKAIGRPPPVPYVVPEDLAARHPKYTHPKGPVPPMVAPEKPPEGKAGKEKRRPKGSAGVADYDY